MAQISCYCTQNKSKNDSLTCDPVTKKQLCKAGIQHCLLVLKQSEDNSFQSHLQGCWVWDFDDRCPTDPSVCYSFANSAGYVNCCCKGDSCNTPSIRVITNPNNQISDAGLANGLIDSHIPSSHSTSLITNPIMFYAITVPLILLVILAAILMLFIYRRFRKPSHAVGNTITCGPNSSSKLSSDKQKSFLLCQNLLELCLFRKRPLIEGYQFGGSDGAFCRSCGSNGSPCYACGYGLSLSDSIPLTRPMLGGGWLAEGEMEELSKMCYKVKICSRGRFGEVWLGKLTQQRCDETVSRDAAIKVFPAAEKKSWETELELYRLPQLRHANILHYIGVDKVTIETSSNSSEEEGDGAQTPPDIAATTTTEFWLVTDFLPFGSIYDYIRARGLSWGEMLRIAIGMARGLSHLHTELPRTATQYPKPSIAHRDFKSRNVLLKPDMTACISDLGLATRLETGRGIGDAHLQVGTCRYMAPEVLDGAIQFTRDAFLHIDVYALGLVIWELMTRATGHQEGASSEEAKNSLPGYMAPFEAELGPVPTMEQLQRCVAKLKKRPLPSARWENNQAFMQLWETVQDSWDQDAEARLTAGCISERIQNLGRQFPPSSDDPVRALPSLSSSSAPAAFSSSSSTSVANTAPPATTTTKAAVAMGGPHLPPSTLHHPVIAEAAPLLRTKNLSND